MSSTPSFAAPPLADHPLQSLGLQARQRPGALALRWQQDGTWLTLSWSQLAQRVLRAAQGWHALGVEAGDGVLVLVGDEATVGEAPVVSLLALLSLGAHLRSASPGHLSRAGLEVRFALARGTQDVDRLLAHAPDGLRAIVVENEFGTEPSPRVRVVSWQDLLQSGPGGEALALPRQDTPALVSEGPDGAPSEWSWAVLRGAVAAPATRQALADFDIGWMPGVRWLLNDWLATGASLVLAAPGAAAGSPTASGPTDLWLVSATLLSAYASRVHQRARLRGAAAWALGARPAPVPLEIVRHLLRTRIRQVLGWGPGVMVLSDAGAGPEALQLVQRLGMRLSVLPESFTAPATASVHHLPRAQPRSDRLLTQVST